MKTIVLSTVLCICFTACTGPTQNDKASNKSSEQNKEESFLNAGGKLHSDTARNWIRGIRRMNLRNDSIAWAEYSLEDLRRLFCDTGAHISRVRFFLGAFDTTGPGNSSRLLPRIVMQIQRDTGEVGALSQYEYLYYTGKIVCPPPYDVPCPIEEEQ